MMPAILRAWRGANGPVDAIAPLMEADTLPLPQQLALNYAPARLRLPTAALFALDARLGELVAKASEPLLGQLRLAWWRDELGKPPAERAKGDPVLDALGETWAGEERSLAGLIDGWEQLLGDGPLPDQAIAAFVEGRARAFAALAHLAGESTAATTAGEAGRAWAFADFAARVTNDEECAAAIRMARETGLEAPSLPRSLRPFAILRGLSRRALARGGGLLIAGRRDVLAALRLGMFGR